MKRRISIKWLFLPIPLGFFAIWAPYQLKVPQNFFPLEDARPGEFRRIITLAPSLTELVSSIGGEERIIGITESCDYPPPILDRPKVANFKNLHLEQIINLRPDLILAHDQEFSNSKELKRLASMGIPVVLVPQPSLREIPTFIEQIGKLIGLEEEAKQRAYQFRKKLDALQIRGSLIRPRVFIQLEHHPLYAAGEKSLVHELVLLSGGENITPALTPRIKYPRLSLESVVSTNPEVILIPITRNQSFEKMKKEWEGFPQLAAVKNNSICPIDASLLVRPGTRIFDGIEKIQRCFQGAQQ